MTFAALCREWRRNILSGASAYGFVVGLAAAVLGALCAHEILNLHNTIAAADEYQAAGADIHIVVAEHGINSEACTALGRVPGVDSAAIRTENPDDMVATVQQGVPIVQVVATGEIAQMLDTRSAFPESGTPGILLGEELAVALGYPSQLATNRGTLPVAGWYRYPIDGRRGGLGYAIISTELPGSTLYDECWIRTWPENPQVNSQLASTVVHVGDDIAPLSSQLNTTLGIAFDGNAQYTARSSRWNWCLALLAGVGIAWGVLQRRRLEVSNALHVGVRRIDAMTVLLFETLTWSISAAVCVLLGCAVWSMHISATEFESLLDHVVRIVGAFLSGSLVGTAVAVALTSERLRYRYFQRRH